MSTAFSNYRDGMNTNISTPLEDFDSFNVPDQKPGWNPQRPPRRFDGSSFGLWALAWVLIGSGVAVGGFWAYLVVADSQARAPAPLPKPERKELAKNIILETQGDQRRVLLQSTVCLREGQLEGLLCKKFSKEHEYILTVDADAALIHAALLAARATPGTPVKFQPRYVPASGTTIKITLQYEDKGKLVTVPAQDWIRNAKTRKPLDEHWVFGGSLFFKDPDDKDKPPIYLANHGDVICVCNMESAMLDLPVRSPKTLQERTFEAATDRIPPLDTKVTIILEPLPGKAPEKDKAPAKDKERSEEEEGT